MVVGLLGPVLDPRDAAVDVVHAQAGKPVEDTRCEELRSRVRRAALRREEREREEVFLRASWVLEVSAAEVAMRDERDAARDHLGPEAVVVGRGSTGAV